MKSLRKFFADNLGFTGAEKALITLLALGLVIIVARFVLFGASKTSATTRDVLDRQAAPAAVEYNSVEPAAPSTTGSKQ